MVREAYELMDGSKPIPIDKITYELAQLIILAFEDNFELKNNDIMNVRENEKKQIEVEARIGMVVDKNMKRLKLPIRTDAIVESQFSDFLPGVEKEDFELIMNVLSRVNEHGGIGKKESEKEETIGKEQKRESEESETLLSPSKKDPFKLVALKTEKSIDKYYVIQDRNRKSKVRITFNDTGEYTGKGSLVPSLVKENIITWNVYLGNPTVYDEEEEEDYANNKNEGNKCTLDYRISINVEITKPISKLFLSKMKPIHERIKERTTFINKYLGLQFDLTKVISNNKETYEVEIEIPNMTIQKAMSHVKKKEDNNYLYFVCSNIVNNIRGICSHLNSLKKNRQIQELSNKENEDIPRSNVPYVHCLKETKRFKKYIHETTPLIGDYMYNVVVKNEKRIRKKMKDSTLSNKEKMNIFQNSIEIRNFNKKSLKKRTPNYANNEWKVIREGTEFKIVLESEGDENEEKGEEAYHIENDKQVVLPETEAGGENINNIENPKVA